MTTPVAHLYYGRDVACPAYYELFWHVPGEDTVTPEGGERFKTVTALVSYATSQYGETPQLWKGSK